MSGSLKRAQRALGCPLDGRVGRHPLCRWLDDPTEDLIGRQIGDWIREAATSLPEPGVEPDVPSHQCVLAKFTNFDWLWKQRLEIAPVLRV